MDSFSDRLTEYVIGCLPAQVGKTEAILNALGYIVDQDPGPVMTVYPSQAQSDKVMRSRIHPMFKMPPMNRHVLAGDYRDLGLHTIKLDRLTIYAGWAHSATTLASQPCRYVLNDEVDKFPDYSGSDGNPLKLSDYRTSTYGYRRKIGIFSTPTTTGKYIWNEYQNSDQRAYWIPCSKCGQYQVPDFQRDIKWPEGSRAADLFENPDIVLYHCSHCGHGHRDAEKGAIVARGKWAPLGVTVRPGGVLEGKAPSKVRAGFHCTGIISPWVKLGSIAGEFLEAKADPGALMAWRNSRLALPWVEREETIPANIIRERVGNYKAGTAPLGARILTGGVDVQKDHMWFGIRAWGLGARSWLVRYGLAHTWGDIERAMIQAVYNVGGEPKKVERCLIDCGYLPDDVTAFCSQYRGLMFPARGSGIVGLPVKVERSPAGGPQIVHRADFFKDRLARYIRAPLGGPESWQVHEGIDDEYVRQMTSEAKIQVRRAGRVFSVWEKVTERAANHAWDFEVLNVIAAEMLGVPYLEAEEDLAGLEAPRPAVELRARPGAGTAAAEDLEEAAPGRGRSGFLEGEGGGWLEGGRGGGGFWGQ
jgi:phage terminase large subunit GpA-like protein